MPDMTRMLSGHPEKVPYPTWTPADMQKRHVLALISPTFTAFAGPWGVSFGANLTPDKDTGIGEWTEEAFIQSIYPAPGKIALLEIAEIGYNRRE